MLGEERSHVTELERIIEAARARWEEESQATPTTLSPSSLHGL